MLRVNLSSRPFYNERVVSAILALVALIVVALTVVNVTELLTQSSRRSGLSSQIARDTAAADRVRANAAAIERSVNREALDSLAAGTREANLLIDQRTFSWTAFFDVIEKTLPIDVRLVSVSPQTDKSGNIVVSLIVVGRRDTDVYAFVSALQGTSMFSDLLPAVEERTQDGMYRASLRGYYVPPGSAKPRAAKGRP